MKYFSVDVRIYSTSAFLIVMTVLLLLVLSILAVMLLLFVRD